MFKMAMPAHLLQNPIVTAGLRSSHPGTWGGPCHFQEASGQILRASVLSKRMMRLLQIMASMGSLIPGRGAECIQK